MAVDQVEYLAVRPRERIECCPDPRVANGIRAGGREVSGMIGNVVIGRVEESESFAKIPGCSGRLRRAARPGPCPIAVQAFPAAERKQPGPHPARVAQTSGQGVAGDKGELSGACGTGPVAEKTATVVEEVARMLIEHLGERVLIALFWPRICWAQRRHSLSLTCHRSPPMRPRLFRCRRACCRLSRCRPNIQFKQGVLDRSGCTIPWPVFAIWPAGG